jgi:hypothetical protein
MPGGLKASFALFTIAWMVWEKAKRIPPFFPAPVTQAI